MWLCYSLRSGGNPGKLQHFFTVDHLVQSYIAVILVVQWKALGKLAVAMAIAELNEA